MQRLCDYASNRAGTSKCSLWLPRGARRTPDVNRMARSGPAHRPWLETIVPRRPDDIDRITASSKTPADGPAPIPRHPAPTETIPVRPIAATEGRPPPAISRSPHISRTWIVDPTTIPIGIEARILRHGGLPHPTLPRHVIPSAVGIQIGPSVALVSGITIARRRLVCRLIHGGLVAVLVPLVPGLLWDLLRQEVAAAIHGIASQALSRTHICPAAIPILRTGAFHLRLTIQQRDHRRGVVQIDPDRRIRDRRDRIATGIHAVFEPLSRSQFRIDQAMHNGKLRLEIPCRVRAQHVQAQRAVRREPHHASILELHLGLPVFAS